MVSIYMPMVPELAIAMLACARLGAVHSVIFGGFSAEAIADRNNDAKATVQITADGGWRRGKALALKATVDEALAKSPTVKQCVVLKRVGDPVSMTAGRDYWWHELVEGVDSDCPALPVDSENTLFILYTSGSTGSRRGFDIPQQDTISMQNGPSSGYSIIARTISSGARRIAGGSRDIVTSFTGRCLLARRR